MKSKLALIFAGATLAVSAALPAQAQRAESNWDCYLNHQNNIKAGSVNIWWGHTEGDAAWACNNWISDCGNQGGCFVKRK
ncbi:hypothetical protein [Nodularia spumigena]|jgi:hypothetical protein|uniref:Uncharacterized protein n=1 Tax=Nodularia spumigena CENA596 TaxID=1819295 RepID=A0A166KEP7_NODSP|nr:hypothetical protein [Nodularia spumigena]KZL51010.1 hypothetical protein A2T98_04535 [Nodularia spumigena CENA596]MEA5558788.1 hypothetical protein [Nodularia spumigena CH309]